MVSHPVRLPRTTELPCSDDIPVDNEDQNLLPNLLLFVLASLWAERMDWYFGVDMAIYHTTGINPRVPVVPDAFLSLGVERRKASRDGKGRLSYALWEEGGIAPIMALEMVSQTPGGEYDEKLEIYRKLGVLYYLVYNPLANRQSPHQPFELYKLVNGVYQIQSGEPYWMPEIGLGIGRAQQSFGGIEMEVLLWHDGQEQPYLLPEETLKQMQSQVEQQRRRAELAEQQILATERQVALERQRAELERQKAELAEQQVLAEQQQKERLADYLRSLGIDPDNLPTND